MRYLQFGHGVVLFALCAAPLVGCGSDGSGTLAPERTDREELAVLALEGVCEQRVVGSLDVCTPISELRETALASCSADGLQAGPVGFAKPCGTDGQSWRLAQVSCCGLPPVEDTGPVCTSVVEGGGALCQTEADYQALARVRCGGTAQVSDVAFGGACEGGWKFAKITCCSAEPVPDPDPVEKVAADGPCGTASFMVGNACADPVVLREEARRICESAGRKTSDIHFVGNCGDGTFATGKVTCCDLPAEPTQLPKDTCSTGLTGGPDSCADAARWLEHAQATCGAQGLAASHLEQLGACGPGLSHYARFSCCPEIKEADRCVVKTLGGGTYCAPASAWSVAAKAACGDAGRDVQSVGVQESCGPGLWRSATVGCCAPYAAKPPPAVANPRLASCTDTELSAPVCRDARAWKDAARSLCSVRSSAVASVEPLGLCDGGAMGARVRCCGEAAPKKLTCEKASVNLEASCLTKVDAGKLALQACQAKGMRPSAVTDFEGCHQGEGGTHFSYSCCP